jgi:hypothetical protein
MLYRKGYHFRRSRRRSPSPAAQPRWRLQSRRKQRGLLSRSADGQAATCMASPRTPGLVSGAHAQRRGHAAQAGDDTGGHDLAGPGVLFAGHVLNLQRQTRAVGLDLDDVDVAVDGGVGPDLQGRALRSDAGESQGGDIDVGGETLGAFGGIALEDALGLVEALQRDAAFDELRRAVEAVG